MSSCLGGRAYRLDLEIIKSPSNSWISSSSSPSSTLSESSNSPLTTISTRKPRTPRKRPNQTYNEAAAILSTAYPKIFPSTKPCSSNKFTKYHDSCDKNPILFEPDSDLLTPFQVFDTSSFLLHPPNDVKKSHLKGSSNFMNLLEKPCLSPSEITSYGNSSEICDEFREDFDAESILDEEIEEGIDSILGNFNIESIENDILSNDMVNASTSIEMNNVCYGYPVGFEGFDFGNGLRNGLRGIRNDNEGDWWRFPSVNVIDTSPKIVEKKKKKKKMVEIKNLEYTIREKEETLVKESIPKVNPNANGNANAGLLLKLNYDDILNAWSDKDSPFTGDTTATGVVEVSRNDVQGRLAQIDLFSENGVREASVLRYKEKRRTRLFSKKIRYQVRKVNADRRPRMKGRFVRTPNSPENDEQGG